jgi:hypothetical protein
MGCVDPRANIFYTRDGTQPYQVKWRGDWTTGGTYILNDVVTGSDGNAYRYAVNSFSTLQPGIDPGWENFWERNGSIQYTMPFKLDSTCLITATAFSEEIPDIEVITRDYQFNIIPEVSWNYSPSRIYNETLYLVPSLVDVTADESELYDIVYTVTGGIPRTVFNSADPIAAEFTTKVDYFVRDIYGNKQGPTFTVIFRVIRRLNVVSCEAIDGNGYAVAFLGGTGNYLKVRFSEPLDSTVVPVYGTSVTVFDGSALFLDAVATMGTDPAEIEVYLTGGVQSWPNDALSLHVKSTAIRGISGKRLTSTYIKQFSTEQTASYTLTYGIVGTDLTTGPSPYGITLDETFLYVLNYGNATVTRYDKSTGHEDSTSFVGSVRTMVNSGPYSYVNPYGSGNGPLDIGSNISIGGQTYIVEDHTLSYDGPNGSDYTILGPNIDDDILDSNDDPLSDSTGDPISTLTIGGSGQITVYSQLNITDHIFYHADQYLVSRPVFLCNTTMSEPYGITSDSTYLYVSNVGNGAVTRYVKATGHLADYLFTCTEEINDPFRLASDGTYLYVANSYGPDGPHVTRYSKDTGAEASSGFWAEVLGLYAFHGITVDDAYIYVANAAPSNTITRLHKSTGANASAGFSCSVNPHLEGIACDSSYLYVTDSIGNAVTRYYKATGAEASTGFTCDTGMDSPYGIACDDDYLYVCNVGNGTITNYDKVTGTVSAYTGDLGTISGTNPQTVISGEDGSQVTAEPSIGYLFVSWSDGVLTASRIDINVSGDITVMASFAVNNDILRDSEGNIITESNGDPISIST